jgi:hypothetical protein
MLSALLRWPTGYVKHTEKVFLLFPQAQGRRPDRVHQIMNRCWRAIRTPHHLCAQPTHAACDREPFYALSARALACAETGLVEGIVAAHSLTTLSYLVAQDQSAGRARVAVTELLQFLSVALVDHATVEQVLNLPYDESEDAAQMMAAVQAGAQYLVTRNGGIALGSIAAHICGRCRYIKSSRSVLTRPQPRAAVPDVLTGAQYVLAHPGGSILHDSTKMVSKSTTLRWPRQRWHRDPGSLL